MDKYRIQQYKKIFLWRNFLSILLVNISIIGLIPGTSWAVNITLGWDANIENDLAGYIVHYGTESGVYSESINVGNTTEYTIPNLLDGVTYYMAVTAYDVNNSKSEYSDEVVYTIGDLNNIPTTPSAPAGPTSGSLQTEYSFSAIASDPDGDDLDYRFDWGDGNVSDWGLASQNHTWSSGGNFCVKAQAQDIHGANSEWSACAPVSINVSSHTISVSAGAHGNIVPAGSVSVANGANQSFSISADQNYQILDVLVDGVSVGAASSYSFENVTANHTISASFVSVDQAPIADAGVDQTVTEGTQVTLNGGNSTDPGGDIDTYSWEQLDGLTVELLNADSAQASFVAPAVGMAGEILRFRLTVSDSGNMQSMDSCEVRVTKAVVEDSDGDGVPDDQDAFPYDAEESLDTDLDGQGNNADTDDDNDGMPDTWELVYGLNPLVDDAAEDPDGDQVNNLDEFLRESDPKQVEGNAPPDVPILIAPIGNEVVTPKPTLQVDGFYDPDSGDVHAETEWTIFWENNCGRKSVFELRSSSALTSLSVPSLILEGKNNYSWQVRFFDSNGKASDWSAAGYFATSQNIADTDANGILDNQEVDSNVDLDGNGVFDLNESDIKCVRIKGTNDNFIGLSIKDSPKIIEILSLHVKEQNHQDVIPVMVAPPGIMPFGLIDFKILVENPGDIAELTVYFSKEIPQGSIWYKYDSVEKIWDDFSDYAILDPNRRSLKLYLEDGGPGDADRVANGIIVDPSGFISPSSFENSTTDGDSSNSGSNSCFIGSLQDGKLDKFKGFHPVSIGIGLVVLLLLVICLIPKVKKMQ